jgi:hypothetical protein
VLALSALVLLAAAGPPSRRGASIP